LAAHVVQAVAAEVERRQLFLLLGQLGRLKGLAALGPRLLLLKCERRKLGQC
jgi:hypothetical protein